MALKNYDDLNDMQLDALCEIGNIGSGNAASALSTMLDKPVNIAVPVIKVLEYERVVDNLGGPENLMIGLLLSLSGDVTGMIMFLLDKEFAHMVINELTGSNYSGDDEMDEEAKSAIMEVGNIMAASYINAMAALTDLRINLSVPSLCIDMVGSILSVPAIYYANISDKIILIEDEFNQEEAVRKDDNKKQATSHILLIPEVEALEKMMISLGLD